MGYLILGILCSAMIAVLMRFSEKKIKNKMIMFTVNYAVCIVMARCFMGQIQLFTTEAGVSTAIVAGVLSGILYLANFVLMQTGMRLNGVVLTSTFMKLGVIVPTVMAILVFKERPKMLQIAGIIIALAAIILVQFEKEQTEAAGKKWFLLILLLMSGITDSMANIYEKMGSELFQDHYLFYTFLAALLLAAILALKDRKLFSKWDFVFGFLVGIPNYLSARFLLLSLASVPAVVTYPVYSVGTIVAVTAAGLWLFKEKISAQKALALGLIMLAMVLLNL